MEGFKAARTDRIREKTHDSGRGKASRPGRIPTAFLDKTPQKRFSYGVGLVTPNRRGPVMRKSTIQPQILK
jgi:hypothetical protein